MKLLMLGGTVFLGRHIVEAAQERGHEITLFTRGVHNPDLFPELEKIRGDRDGNLQPLAGKRWDAVIDPSGYVPRIVGDSARFLRDAAHHYTFISTLSVFSDVSLPGITEDGTLATLDDQTVEEVTGDTYGGLKVLCEKVVEEVWGDHALIVRPGLIVGPHDPTDRFTYWPHRIARGGDVLAPESPDIAVQFIDVRDLAEWTVRLVEQGVTGMYNATGPEHRLTMGETLDACIAITGSDAHPIWVPASFLAEEKVEPWSDMPLWVPDEPGVAGFSAFDVSKAINAGLAFRPLHDTIRATLDWDAGRGDEQQWQAGMTAEREASVLAQWRERSSFTTDPVEYMDEQSFPASDPPPPQTTSG